MFLNQVKPNQLTSQLDQTKSLVFFLSYTLTKLPKTLSPGWTDMTNQSSSIFITTMTTVMIIIVVVTMMINKERPKYSSTDENVYMYPQTFEKNTDTYLLLYRFVPIFFYLNVFRSSFGHRLITCLSNISVLVS